MTGGDADVDRRDVVQDVARRLHGAFDGVFSIETVERLIAEGFARFDAARYDAYVPVLAERFARDRLREAMSRQGAVMSDKPTVLFLCVHNAGRSQMAAGFLRALGADAVDVFSGGSEPAAQVNPVAVAAMAERGIDIAGYQPQRWSDDEIRAADVVVTMGCGDACPLLPGQRYEDWELTDPFGKSVDAVRPIRDEIERRVRGLLRDLGVQPG